MKYTRNTLRVLARRLCPKLPAKPYGDGRDYWTVYHSLCEAYRKNPQMLADDIAEQQNYKHAIDRAASKLASDVQRRTGCDWEAAASVAQEIIDERQLLDSIDSERRQFGQEVANMFANNRPSSPPARVSTNVDKSPAKPATVALPASVSLAMGATR